MSMIEVKCVDQTLMITNAPLITTGDVETDEVHFEFCSKWEGYAKFAVFWVYENNAKYKAIDESTGVCSIPSEVLEKEGCFWFGVFGCKTDESGELLERRTTEVLKYRVKKGTITDVTKPKEPTPDIYEQILTKYSELIAQSKVFSPLTDEELDQIFNGTYVPLPDDDPSQRESILAEVVEARGENDTLSDRLDGIDTRIGEEEKARKEADNALGTRIDKEATARAKDIKELNEKKITKFYASSLGNTNLPDSDSGKPTDMIIYGKSVQDGTPTPTNPIEIQSVVNPKVTVCGKNLKDITQSKVAIGYYIDSSGEINKSNSNFIRIVPIKVLPNTIYSISCNLKIYSIWFFNYDTKIKNVYFSDYKATFKTPIDCSYIRVSLYNESGKNDTSAFRYCQLEFGLTATDYESYKEQSATLPYTLNAIPVTNGGNVTIDGQQYVADYVDVERKKLVRCVGDYLFKGTEPLINTYYPTVVSEDIFENKGDIFKLIINNYSDSSKISYANVSGRSLQFNRVDTYWNFANADELKAWIKSLYDSGNPFIVYYVLNIPTETDLTDEEIEAFKALETYYPVTNVFVTSDQVDGYTVFNYPLNMANGWNYVMEQIGETRPIIYDTEVKVLENAIDTAILTAMMEV